MTGKPYSRSGASEGCFGVFRSASQGLVRRVCKQGAGNHETLSSVGADSVGYLCGLWTDDGFCQSSDARVVDTGRHAVVQAQSEHRLRDLWSSVDGMPLYPERTVPAAGV